MWKVSLLVKNVSPVLDYNSKLLKNAQRCFYPPFMSSLTLASAPSPASFCGTHLYSPIDLIQSILTVVVPTKEAAIEIELVN